MSDMRYKRYSLPGLLIILCLSCAKAQPTVGGQEYSDAPKVENQKSKKTSWDECKELLKKAKEKKQNSTEKENKQVLK